MVSPYSLTVPGGVQSQILGLATALRAKGESVRVLGPCDGPPPATFVTPLGNSLPTGANGSIAPIAPDPAAQLRTIRALRDEEFDVIHVHEPLAPGPTTTALLIKPAPAVATFHAAGSSLAYRTIRPILARGARRIDKRFAVSKDARDLAFNALGGEYEIVFNGVEVERFATAQPRKTDGSTIFFVARHEPRKGLEVLLRSMTELGPDHRLWIGGLGPETRRLQGLFAGDPRIEWLGELDERSKLECLRGADVLCAPSLHGESFGIVLLEAMAAGTAVVASDIAGYSSVARSGKDALLVPPGDSRILGRSLREILDNADRRSELVASSAERVKRFSMRRLADRYLAAYDELLSA